MSVGRTNLKLGFAIPFISNQHFNLLGDFSRFCSANIPLEFWLMKIVFLHLIPVTG